MRANPQKSPRIRRSLVAEHCADRACPFPKTLTAGLHVPPHPAPISDHVFMATELALAALFTILGIGDQYSPPETDHTDEPVSRHTRPVPRPVSSKAFYRPFHDPRRFRMLQVVIDCRIKRRWHNRLMECRRQRRTAMHSILQTRIGTADAYKAKFNILVAISEKILTERRYLRGWRPSPAQINAATAAAGDAAAAGDIIK